MKVNWRRIDIRCYAAASSLLLSVIAVLMNQVPNRDAFIYMRTAEILLADGIQAAMTHYTWVGYPALIALVQLLPGIDMYYAAQVVNAALFVLVTMTFITLARELDPSKRVAILAAIVILAYPQINEFRAHLIRDIGFLGFCLLALLNLIRFHRDGATRSAVVFCAALVAAFIFRAEALAFLLLTPIALLFGGERSMAQRLRKLGTVYLLSSVLAAVVFLLALAAGINVFEQLRIYLDIYLPFVQQSLETLSGDTRALRDALFTEHAAPLSSSDIPVILVGGLTALLAAMIIESFGLLFLGVLLYGWYHRLGTVPTTPRASLLAFAITGLLVLLAFTLIARFMTTRYTMVFCVVIVLLVPLIIDRAWTRAQARGTLKRFGWLLGYIALYSMIDSHISFGEPKDYTIDAMAWINNNADATAPLLTNKSYIAWRSGRVPDYDRVERDTDIAGFINASPGTLVVIERDADLLEQLDRSSLVNLQTFEDRRGPRVVIYQVP